MVDFIIADPDAFDDEAIEQLRNLGIPVIKKRMRRSVELFHADHLDPRAEMTQLELFPERTC